MIRIDLLKPEKKELKEIPGPPIEEIKKKKKAPASSLIVLLFIIAAIALLVAQRSSINREKDLLNKAEEEKKKLQDVIAKLDRLEKQKSLYEKKISLIKQSKAYQEVPVKILDEVSKNLPEWVWLTETKYDNQTITIKGKALSNNLISDYIFNLENSPYLENINLISSIQRRVRNEQVLEFSLNGDYVFQSTSNFQSEEDTKKEKK